MSQKDISFIVRVFDEIPSTNLAAKDLIKNFESQEQATSTKTKKISQKEVQVIQAIRQTNGYGKLGRQWYMQEGDVAVSFLWFRPEIRLSQVTELTFVMSIALSETIKEWGVEDTRISLKWPNDVLLDGGKVGGCLLEFEAESGNSDSLRYLIVGIGVNLVGKPLPENVMFPTACLKDFVEHVPDSRAFVKSLSKRIAKKLVVWKKQGFDPIRKQWEARAWMKENIIRAAINDKNVIEGRFMGLAEDGALLIRSIENGREVKVYAADVFGNG